MDAYILHAPVGVFDALACILLQEARVALLPLRPVHSLQEAEEEDEVWIVNV